MKFKFKLLLVLFFALLLTSLWPGNIYILVFFSILTYFILPINKWWNGTALLLMLFSVLYSVTLVLTNQVHSVFILIAYTISPVAFYRMGIWLLNLFQYDSQRQKLLFTIVLSFLIPLFVLTIKDILVFGVVNMNRAMTGNLDVEDALSATYYGLIASVGIGCVSSVFAKDMKLSLRIGYIVISLLSILVVVHLVNRTGLVIWLVCLFVSFFITAKTKLIRTLPTVIFVSIAAYIVFKLGILGDDVILAYQQRELHETSNAQEFGGRVDLWVDALVKLVYHPFGWERQNYAHNFLLDVARVGGWIPFLILLLATCGWLRSLTNLLRKSQTPFALLITTLNIAMLLSVMVEPVLDSSIFYFSMFVFVWGITSRLNYELLYKIS